MLQEAEDFYGVMENVSTGNTTGTLEVIATIQRAETNCEVRIFAKPQAIANQNFTEQPQMQISFDSTGPIFNRQGTDVIKIEKQARSYYEILKHLEPLTNSTK
jgi:hypothetical protein